MLISASRRTDIPACFPKWFLRRIEEGYVLVRNPMNPHQVSRVSLAPRDVDGIMFWTKNPLPMLEAGLSALKNYLYCFQFTVNAYGKEVEPNIPDTWRVMVPAFRRLAQQIGPQRVLWRYDPIFFSRTYTAEWHLQSFAALARALAPYTRQCTISFLDYYRNTARRMAPLGLQRTSKEEKVCLAAQLAAIARQEGLPVYACAEEDLPAACGVAPASCMDSGLFESLLGCPLPSQKTGRSGRAAAVRKALTSAHITPAPTAVCTVTQMQAPALLRGMPHSTTRLPLCCWGRWGPAMW